MKRVYTVEPLWVHGQEEPLKWPKWLKRPRPFVVTATEICKGFLLYDVNVRTSFLDRLFEAVTYICNRVDTLSQQTCADEV